MKLTLASATSFCFLSPLLHTCDRILRFGKCLISHSFITFHLRQLKIKSLSHPVRSVGTDGYKPPTHTVHCFAYYFLIIYIIIVIYSFSYPVAVKSLLNQYDLGLHRFLFFSPNNFEIS